MALLDQILHFDNLKAAWTEVSKSGGAAGIDRVTITRWQRRWEERLVNLRQSVKRGKYQPQKPRLVFIPKADGSFREISILTVTDRVLQRAVLRVIDDIFDRTFLDCSYGFRAGRGVRDAVKTILALRDSGFTWVLDADIDNCFESLSHQFILNSFAETIQEPALLRLIELWLEMGQTHRKDKMGILMGGVISPLLCNVILNRFDFCMVEQGYHLVRYADDFCVFCSSAQQLCRTLAQVEESLNKLNLRLEPRKTHKSSFETGFQFLGVRFQKDSYRFNCQEKIIVVQGEFDDWLFYDYVPEGYGF